MDIIQIEILFTTTEKLGSKLIRGVTGEDVSHCVIRSGPFVIHSNLKGVIIEPYDVFIRKNRVIYSIKMHCPASYLSKTVGKFYGKPYDIPAILYIGLRYMLPNSWTEKQNLWQSSGMFICTEFVTKLVNQKADSMITPYKLYLKLKKQITKKDR